MQPDVRERARTRVALFPFFPSPFFYLSQSARARLDFAREIICSGFRAFRARALLLADASLDNRYTFLCVR